MASAPDAMGSGAYVAEPLGTLLADGSRWGAFEPEKAQGSWVQGSTFGLPQDKIITQGCWSLWRVNGKPDNLQTTDSTCQLEEANQKGTHHLGGSDSDFETNPLVRRG